MTDQFADEAALTAAVRQRAEDLKRAVRDMLQHIAAANAANEGCVPAVFPQYFERTILTLGQLELTTNEGLRQLRLQLRELKDVTTACFTCFMLTKPPPTGVTVQTGDVSSDGLEKVVRFERPNG